MQKYVVGVGAANVDVHARSASSIVMRDSNPGKITTSSGGVTRNIMENLARLGAKAYMLSALGDDVFGDKIRADAAAAGLDISRSLTVKGARSSCYTAVVDEGGDMFVAASDMSIVKNLTPQFLDSNKELIQGAAAVVTDGCLAPELMRHLVCDTARGVPVFADAVSTSYARTIEGLLGEFYAIKPNRMELAVLAGMPVETDDELERAADAVTARGVQKLFVSLGERGCYYASAGGERVYRALRPVAVMADATGGGDAFMAAAVFAHINGFDTQKTLDYALAAGIVAISSESTINPDMSAQLIEKTIKENRI